MAKRLAKSSTNWAKLSEMVNSEVRPTFLAFKSKSEKFLRAVEDKPAELPKLDWAYYKSKIALPGFVDNMKSGYESIKIPYPTDQGFLAKVEKQEKELADKNKKKGDEVNKEVSQLEEKIKQILASGRYSEMTLEQFAMANPHIWDPEKPTLWPQLLPENEKTEEKSEH